MEYGSVALWLALYLALAFVGLPLAAALFPRLADRGASVALPLVLLVVFGVSYVLGRVSLAASVLVSLLVLGVLVVATTRREFDVDTGAFLEVAAVFTLAFCFLVAVRAVDPGIVPGGGEKFLDFGLLKAILRADALPPEDFWFAGESMRYYYGGHLVVAQLVRLTGTTPSVAYNLALSGFFATYVTAAYGLAGNVAARAGTFARRAAMLAAFFVAVASNLFTPIRLLLRPLPDDLAESVARAVGVWAGRFEESRRGAVVTDRQPFSMWDATGVIDETIHEMPLFAFVNGDLHAHMMAPGFTLLAATVLFAYWRTPATDRRRRLLLLFGLVPAIAGALAVVNTWSFPAMAGLTGLAIVFDRGSTTTLLPAGVRERIEAAGRLRTELVGIGLAVASAAVVAILGVCWSLPFWLTNASGRSLGMLPDRSTLPELLVVHGGFLLPIAVYLAYLAWAQNGLSRRALATAAVATGLGLAVTAWLGLAAVGLLVPVLLGGYLLGSRLTAGAESRLAVDDERLAALPGFELVLICGAVGLVLLAEFLFLNEIAMPGRFNTVFKVYAQVWVFFAVGTAVALGRLSQLSRVAAPLPRWPTVLRVSLAVLLVGLSVYGAFALGLHFGSFVESDAEATLDGTRYVEIYHSDEARAIDWLDARDGTPTIVTAPGEAYSWTSAPSALTGVPTVIGWQHQERVWGRSAEAVSTRASDVDAIYAGDPGTQRELLVAYDVEYVYVGPTEFDRYDDVSVHRLEAVREAYAVGDVIVYEVDREALDERRG